MDDERPARPYVSPDARAAAAIALVGASAAGFAVLVAQGLLGPPVTIPARDLAARVAILAVGLGTLAAYGGFLGAAIALPMWTHRCCRNLPALGMRGHLTPAWSAWSWLIPVANLVLPAIALRDLWSAPSARGWRWLLVAWWAAWLVAIALWTASTVLPTRVAVLLIPLYEAVLAVAGLLLALVVLVVTRQQDARAAGMLA